MNKFKEGVNKILPVIKEATAKERAMMGSRSGASSGTKRKREPDTTADANSAEYFFAKYLTSPELLDLEMGAPLPALRRHHDLLEYRVSSP